MTEKYLVKFLFLLTRADIRIKMCKNSREFTEIYLNVIDHYTVFPVGE